MKAEDLRRRIITNLESQGFITDGKRLHHPAIDAGDKDAIRKMQSQACQYLIDKLKSSLYYRETEILDRFAVGRDIVPERITPRLVYAQKDTLEDDIVKYIRLSTAVPSEVQRGRQHCFVVEDTQNDKVIGALVIGTTLILQGDRDAWIGWTQDQRRKHMRHIAEGWTLVSIPPYSQLMGGKLMALLSVTNEARDDYCETYNDQLALMTTSSAFGRSSVYNRLKYRDEQTFIRVGWTKGCGRFHFDNGDLLDCMRQFVIDNHPKPPLQDRLFLISTCLGLLGLPSEWIYHGIRREMFVMPMARNTRAWLCDKTTDALDYIDRPMSDVVGWWKERWMLKRASWDRRYLDAAGSDIRIWKERFDGVRGRQLQMLETQVQDRRRSTTAARGPYVSHVPRQRVDTSQTLLPLDV